MFLESGGEVCIDGVPATVDIYGVGCWWWLGQFHEGVDGRLCCWWGGSVLVMERILRRRLPGGSMCVLGWQRTFFHAVLGGMVEEQMGWPLVLVEWGARGV